MGRAFIESKEHGKSLYRERIEQKTSDAKAESAKARLQLSTSFRASLHKHSHVGHHMVLKKD
jgi:hypothetical protein